MTTPQAFELALQHHQAGRLAEAETLYRQILAVQPNHAEARQLLGVIAHQVGRHDLAVECIGQALVLDPANPVAHCNLGEVYRALGRLDEATAGFRRALELEPNYPEAHNNLGNALREQGQLDEATAAIGRALELRPNYAEAHNNLGTILARQGRSDQAVDAYQRALELMPGLLDAQLNLGTALTQEGRLDEAIAAYRRALEIKPADPAILSYLIFVMPLCPACDALSIQQELARWNRLYAEPLRPDRRPHANNPDPHRRLKIGYVSPDFRSHPVSFFLAALFEAHDHESCEIYCYASVRRPDAVTARLRQSADVWRDVRALSDAQMAECIRADGIDILVDLAMHTAGNRLPVFARQPAPVQVSWLAYPGSSGLETIDYRLTDAHLDPPGEPDAGIGGQPVRLPDAWCCYAPVEEFPLVGPLPAAQKGTVTFGSINRFNKTYEKLLRCWAKLLEAVPGSRLLMICPEGQAQDRTRTFFTAQGIDQERLELVAPAPWPDYVRLFERIDLALDPYPCNGLTTTCHALWMGVPTVTLAGTSAVSRAGRSLLHAAGLSEWVARSEEEYLHIAAAWAADLPRLATLRATLRARMEASPLMDAPRFAGNLETAYRSMWQHWCAAQPSSPR